MFRDSSDADSMFVDVVATEGNGVSMQWRSATGGGCGDTDTSGVAAPAASNPVWVKLVKSGTTYTGYYSTDGVHWTSLGSVTVGFSNIVYLGGLSVTAHNNGDLNTATFTSAGTLGDLSDADIGSPGDAGSGSYNASADTATVAGGGSDIWNASDQFNYLSGDATGDGTLVAEVTSITNTNGWAKAGVMFRDSLAAGSMFVDMVATESSGVSLQWRNATGGQCGYTEVTGIGAPSATAPVWVKLVKSGTTYTGYYSANGTSWTSAGSTSVTFGNSTFCGGLAVTAHNNGALNTATFGNIEP